MITLIDGIVQKDTFKVDGEWMRTIHCTKGSLKAHQQVTVIETDRIVHCSVNDMDTIFRYMGKPGYRVVVIKEG